LGGRQTCAPPVMPGPDEIDIDVDAENGRVRVRGPVDPATTPRLRAALQASGRGGVRVLDLSGVTGLTSAGVRLLHELAAADSDLRIVAPPYRPAHGVLRLAGLGDRVVARA
jgi:ABC-type transporter Mla MlaB component